MVATEKEGELCVFLLKKIAMHKTLFYLLMAMACLSIVSCSKKETAQEPRSYKNKLIPIESETKTQNYLMSVQIGHKGEGCKGCVTILGVTAHVDCMNYGDYCARYAVVSLDQVGSAITATTIDTFDLTSENFFAMPARSLDYIDKDNQLIYLNIPAQLVFRDTTTQQFTFTGLFFSNTAAYNNY